MKIPFLDLRASHGTLKREIMSVWEEILDSASFVGGRYVTDFESQFAGLCEVAQCVAVGSGTDALRFILLALGLGPGDEVITVSNTFIATTEAITQAGGIPVFVDVLPDTYLMDPDKIQSAISKRTKGIIPVHLYGQTADMDPILSIASRNGLWVVEDACQAHLAEYRGRKAGGLGIASAFSFYPGKNLGACGEAGAVVTNDLELASKVRMLRDHGQLKKYHHEMEGYNGRCDALQAAVLTLKLKHLPKWNEARRANAAHYRRLLNGSGKIQLPKEMEGCRPVYHLFVIQVDHREQVAARLEQSGIGTGLHYPVPLHLQQAYTSLGVKKGRFPVTEACAGKLLSLPMYPELTEAQIRYVCDQLTAAVREWDGVQN